MRGYFLSIIAIGLLIVVGVSRADNLFRLGAGDTLRVTVFGEDDLSGTFSLDEGGRLAMPLLGPIFLEGLSLEEAEKKLTKHLREGWLRYPQVALEVTSHRPFYILGEVRSPGAYPWTIGLSVIGAVALGGGFTYRADEDDIDVQRPSKTFHDAALTRPVYPGDIIYVHQRFF